MNDRKRKAAWWVLYLLIIGVFIAGWFEARSQLATWQHQLIEIGGLFVLYVLISLWIKVNTGAIILDDFERYQAKNRARKDSVNPDSNPGHRENRIFIVKMGISYRSTVEWLTALAATIISMITQGN